MSIVIDSSITLAWIYDDEVSPLADKVWNVLQAGHAWVPSLWYLEIANSLQVNIRRKRIDGAYRDKALADLKLLDIRTDGRTDLYAWTSILKIADEQRLTVYDAAYAELAHRLRLPLATLDRELAQAAKALGIEVFGTD